VLRYRLHELPAEAKAALGEASVIGRTFSLALLQRVTGQSAPLLLAALDPALRAGAIELAEPGEYAFRNEMSRDAIYSEVSGGERARLHARVGQALEDPTFGAAAPSVLAWPFYCAAPLG